MQNYEQLEDFLQIIKLIDLKYPLNRTRGWAASPDYIKIIYKEILKNREKELTIVECGSGISTIMISYLLKKFFKNSKIYSLEHNIDYAKKNKEELKENGLEKYAKIIYAPLKKYVINGKTWQWYDTDRLLNYLEKDIDFLIVDGPPMTTQKNARYPAIYLLNKYLSDNFVLILDDANRKDEKEIVKLWKREIEFYDDEFIDTEKGTFILRKKEFSYKPLISICIPTYNRKNYLIEAIDSALNQNYLNYEIVVVDDCSNYDVKKEVIDIFNSQKIRFFKNKKNRGRPFTRNRCIEESKGEFILWLDDDDKLIFDTLLKYVRLLNQYKDIDVIYGKLKVMNENRLFIDPIDFYKNSKYLSNLLITNGCMIPNPSTLVKREIYNHFGKYNDDFKRAQDYEFWSRISLYSNFKKCNDITLEYRLHKGSVSQGEIFNFDTSYESLIKRKMINKKNINDIFYYLNDIYMIEKEISSSLEKDLDILNSLYYGFFNSIDKNDQNELKKKIIYAIKLDNLNLAKYILKYLKDEKDLKNIISFYIKTKKRLDRYYEIKDFNTLNETLNLLNRVILNSWLFLYYKSLILFEKDKDESEKFARTSLIVNPFSKKSEELMIKMVSKEEIDNIKKRVLAKANFLEDKKEIFLNKYWENI